MVERTQLLTTIRFPRYSPMQGRARRVRYFLYAIAGLEVAAAFLLWRLRAGESACAVNVHGIRFAPIICPIARLVNVRAVVTIHFGVESMLRQRRALIRAALSMADEVISVSSTTTALVGNLAMACPVVTIPVWADSSRFFPGNRETPRRQFGWEEKFVVLFVGRLLEGKGVRIVEELAGTMRRAVNTIFCVVGTGPLAKELAEAAQLHPNLRYLGRVSKDALPDYYRAADLLIVPSTAEGEGTPIVIAEALMCGTPVVASNRGGIPDMIGTVGRVVNPNVGDFERAITEVQALKKESALGYSQLRSHCFEFAMEHLSPRNYEAVASTFSLGSPQL